MKWNILVGYLDIIAYIFLTIPLLYSFAFVWLSIRKRNRKFSSSGPENRILLILVGENENKLLPENYFCGHAGRQYDICFIAREELRRKMFWKNLAITYIASYSIPVKYNLQQFLEITKSDDYQIVLLLEEENILPTDFFIRINRIYNSGVRALQLYRTPDEPEDDKTLLKAIIQEINFAVLCKGHVKAGLSSGFTAPGIMLDYNWLKHNIEHLSLKNSYKVMEKLLTKQNINIEFLEDMRISGMKRGTGYQSPWITLNNAPHLLFGNLLQIPFAIFYRKWNYLDKIFQEILPSRPFFMIGIITFTLFFTFFDGWLSLKWWLLILIILLFYALAIPDDIVNGNTKRIIKKVPYWIMGTLFSWIGLKKSGK